MYAKPEELVAWYPQAGFVARKKTTAPESSRNGVIVIVVRVVCKDRNGQSGRDEMVKILGDFADWVQANEPDTLGYAIMTRPKAGNEVLIFERYTTSVGFDKHMGSAELKASMTAARKFMDMKKSAFDHGWEVEGSFVGSSTTDGEKCNDGPSSKL